jgi:hypothetical protein
MKIPGRRENITPSRHRLRADAAPLYSHRPTQSAVGLLLSSCYLRPLLLLPLPSLSGQVLRVVGSVASFVPLCSSCQSNLDSDRKDYLSFTSGRGVGTGRTKSLLCVLTRGGNSRWCLSGSRIRLTCGLESTKESRPQQRRNVKERTRSRPYFHPRW